MPENNAEFSYNTPEAPSPQATQDDVEDPTDAELEAFASEAEEIYKEAQGLNLDNEAKRIRHMEELFEFMDNPNRPFNRKRDVQHLRGLLTESGV
jgi:hypothetical protein